MTPRRLSICKVHDVAPFKTTCQHVQETLLQGSKTNIKVYLYAQELFLIDKYYHKVWICTECASQNELPLGGAIFYSQRFRDAFHKECDFDDAENVSIPLLENNIKPGLRSVCSKCFDEHITCFEADIEMLAQHQIPSHWA